MYESDLEQYVQRFEDAWQKNGSADISDFLPPSDHPNHDEITVELIRCEMELSWQDFDDRKLDNYREKFPGVLNNSQLLEQVAFEEYRLRTQSGEQVNASEYQLRYGITTYHWPELKESPVAGGGHETDKFSVLPTHKSDVESSVGADISSRLRSGIRLPDLTTVENRLHKRLRFISLTFALLLIYFALLVYLNPTQKVGLFLGSFFLVALNAICLAVCVAITVILWIRKSIKLQLLRILEISLFGVVLLELSAGLYSDLFIDHELREPMQDDHSLFHYSSSWSLPFFALIVGYGTLVPSSWKRCTIMVSVMAVTPIVICTLAAGMEQGLNQSFFQSFLLQMVLWMAMAAAIAIYGVHRLETLERRFSKSGKLGKYRLVRQLGTGGMGSIYLAHDTLLQRPCAVKLMLQSAARDPNLFARFEREVQVLAAISHTNVVQIFDYGHSEGGIFYYVMEYLEGSNLEELVKKHPSLEPADVAAIMRQTCAALKQVHQHGLVHRDIKPSNIIACDSEEQATYKLLDFGLVKTISRTSDDEQLTQDGAIIGTPAFMSPEQASGEVLDVRTDLYSLGAVAYYLLTGGPPFDKRTVVETLSAHIHEKPENPSKLRSNIPIQLSEIVVRCLAKDPANRFESVDELEAALNQIEV